MQTARRQATSVRVASPRPFAWLLPVHGIVTTGPALDPDAVTAPSNVTVVAAATHSQILDHAAVVVTHGGHGTVVRALAAGVPMVVLHHGRDQADNADRITARGAGIALRRTAAPSDIATAVRLVLDDQAFARAAERLGESIRRDAAGGTLVAELEGCGGGRRPAATGRARRR